MVKDKELKEQLKLHFGFDYFKGNQEAIIKNVLAGKDTFVLMPTGGGKSLCYQLPALIMEGTAIVVSPLIALMKNQVDAMRTFSVDNGIAHFLNSSLPKSAVESVKEDVRNGKTKLLYVAPESLAKEDNLEFLKSIKVSFFAIDEAQCISEWGHDFRPEYRKIRPVIDALGGNIGVIALTATATKKVQQDIQKSLDMHEADVFKSSFDRENLYYEIRPKTDDIDKEIIRLIKYDPYYINKSGIIYCLSRKKVDELTETLKVNGISALAYHAGMETGTRSENQDQFLFKKVDVIVATIAFGMGIDKPDVRYVIHYDMSKSLEGYYQETGRAGRDGGGGRCIAFYSKKDLQKLEKFVQKKSATEQEIGKQLLRETAEYAESTLCRRRVLLHYFGEEYQKDNCCNCDNCLNPKKQVDAKDLLMTVLDTVNALNGNQAIDYVIDIVLGNSTNEIEENGHDELDTFGEAKESSESVLNTVINQAISEGYLSKDSEDGELITVTADGNKFLKKPKAFKIVSDDDEDGSEEATEAPINSSGADSFAVDPELYGLLKDLRKKVAQKNDCPPYVVFQDPSLEAMATVYPISIEELQNIPGVGAGKAKRFGDEFIKLIKKHVVENEIERPEDLRVRSVPNKSKLKVAIIQAIDRKIPLDDIAESKGLDFDELLTEIESIVESGTKINIDFFLAQVMDEDRINDIFDYFREESQSDDINDAVEGLGGDYTEEEIRLIRIKFLSEMGN
ncbi:MAG: DNA helicase RecQ [Paludibacteraceae bacterium]|nr:DNA helicase RecQ [Paludibacteraceae bacterium]